MAAGCRDSFPTVQPALDVLYFPVGLAVRQLPPTPATPYGSSQLAVVNSNFDLRYDEQSGGTLLLIDPDRSQDTELGGQMAVLGSLRVASFGGEVAMVDGGCPAGWPDCPTRCPQLAADPVLAAGGGKVVLASRSARTIYQVSMGADGSLECGDSCPYPLPIDRLDPYGISVACSSRSGTPAAYAFVSHLLAANNLGWLTRVDLLTNDVVGLILGFDGTYTSVFDRTSDLVFVSSSVVINAQFRWFNPLISVSTVDGYAIPDYAGPAFSSFMPGAVARDMALSSDGRFLYVTVNLYDLALAAQTGQFFTLGGALAVFDLSESSLAGPRMALLGVERTCLGTGQIRRLPARPNKPDLFAITCDVEGALVIYDSDARRVVRYIGQNPSTGLPALGLQPFGLAVEPIDPGRATIPVQGSGYDPSPCAPGRDCQRIYVASFMQNWVNVLELDPDRPSEVALVKRIGRGP
jgi:hypothetical protein